jgi:hypothetical protein
MNDAQRAEEIAAMNNTTIVLLIVSLVMLAMGLPSLLAGGHSGTAAEISRLRICGTLGGLVGIITLITYRYSMQLLVIELAMVAFGWYLMTAPVIGGAQ